MKKIKIHIIPIGFEEDRAVHGLINIGADRIYLFIDNKKNAWGEEARKHADIVKRRLKEMAFDQSSIIDILFDPTDFDSCRKSVGRILEKEKEDNEVYINVSSSTKLSAIAFTLASIDYSNTFLYYVVPQEYNLPQGGAPFSVGARRTIVFSPREMKFGDVENKILKVLSKNQVNNLVELNKHIYTDDISKASQAKLSYYVRKLEKEGIVDYRPGKGIELTKIGLSRVKSLKDDAKMTVS